jgi:hypothetical protein
VQQLSHCVHALPSPPDHPALSAMLSSNTILGNSSGRSLFLLRRVEHAHAGGDHLAVFSAGLSSLDRSPADRCNSKVDTKDTLAHDVT